MLSFSENKNKRSQKANEKAIKQEAQLGDSSKRKPAWVDKNTSQMKVGINDVSRLRKLKKTEDEKEIGGKEYSDRLKNFYEKMQSEHSMFDWARQSTERARAASTAIVTDDDGQNQKQNNNLEDDSDSDDPIGNLLKSNTAIFCDKQELLQSGTIKNQRLRNALATSQHQSVVTSMAWHPNENLLLTSGLDRKAKLVSVKGQSQDQEESSRSQIVQQLFIEDLPIYSCNFIKGGNEAVFAGNRRHFYSYDLGSNRLQKQGGILGHHDESNLSQMVVSPKKNGKMMAVACAQSGYILVLGQDSKKLLFDLKMNGSCQSVAFDPEEKYLYSVGDEAEIYQWDLNMRKCIGRVPDSGSFSTTKLAVSPNGQLLATGSKMGTVNIFHVDQQTDSIDPKPFKTVMNLTTAITDLKFNHSSELLTFCSKWKKNAFKMCHIPSYTVYQNFPGAAPGVLKYPFSLAFSAKSEYIAMGNDEGKAHLFQLSHFSQKSKL